MKTTIYELLGMIKDGKAPKKILYKKIIGRVGSEEEIYIYNKKDKMYYRENKEKHEYWTDAFMIIPSLDDEVEILETTITYKQNENIKEKIIKLQSEIDILENQISKLHNEAHSLRDSNSYMKKKLKELMTIIK